jgi:undecaprenyl diphosphate synthase
VDALQLLKPSLNFLSYIDVETQTLPSHIAIIPDGNRRWARKRKLKPWRGHQTGVEQFHEVSKALCDFNIPFYTFWGASENNLLKRTKTEVKFLVALLKRALKQEIKKKTLLRDQVRFRIIGRWDEILNDSELRNIAKTLETETEKFSARNLTLLFGYSGTSEMIAGIKNLKNGKQSITEKSLHAALWTHDLPPVDLVIRTGGEPHLSAGFMMWLTTNSQLYFTDTLWPDFDKQALNKALSEYSKRERRFGK